MIGEKRRSPFHYYILDNLPVNQLMCFPLERSEQRATLQMLRHASSIPLSIDWGEKLVFCVLTHSYFR